MQHTGVLLVKEVCVHRAKGHLRSLPYGTKVGSF